MSHKLIKTYNLISLILFFTDDKKYIIFYIQKVWFDENHEKLRNRLKSQSIVEKRAVCVFEHKFTNAIMLKLNFLRVFTKKSVKLKQIPDK